MPPLVKDSSSYQGRGAKSVEEIYQKKTQLEHILLRPDTYVGSVEHQFQEMWIYDLSTQQIVFKKIDFVPALYKIFDEILVNAADNLIRDPKGMDTITIDIDKKNNMISIMNNGKGVPVQMHKEHKCYVPELIFGHLLTSDNYNDDERKVTGGRNGYGAKLTNVFSKKFIIETADKKAGKKFVQVFEDNMSKKNTPKLSAYSGAEYTKVTFYPDLKRFGMEGLDDDIVGLFMKRAYDLAGSTPMTKRCKVILNGETLKVTSFNDYVGLYVGDSKAPIISERCSERWEVAVSMTEGQFQQCSFVNSICTTKGGTHVQHIADQLVEQILKAVKAKNRGGIEIKPANVKNHLWVFVNCLIENPAFDSQTKETLTTKQTKFGSSCELGDKMLKQVMKSGIVEAILDWAKAKQKVDLGRKMKASGHATRILGIPKLEDANDAGGKHSADCSLILTEGDSAKALAVAGLSVIGRDRYGVFPLKGKVINVRDANFKQVTSNVEIQNIMKIVGLSVGKEYVSPKQLRYGSIMIMTDQDHDGSHIKGLLINLVQHWWPSLIMKDGFLKEFVTPIVKVSKSHGKEVEEISFFTIPEYEAWKKTHNDGKGWTSKYYKGLGTSTAKEAKEYFKNIEHHEIMFTFTGNKDNESIDLAFNKQRADDRKLWINGVKEGTHVDHSKDTLSYTDFVHKELVLFAQYDVMRSIPSVVDGFKPTQRKILFSSFKKKLKNDIKVAQFVGYISEHSAYHHGEMSLENAVVNMAQNFVGSNNVNLLVPSGQFGTRLLGGKDHAAARYIYTRLSDVTRNIFIPEDDNVLKYLKEEGQMIEPEWYCPIIPMVLVNGADGIGTGWSTFIPNYNPRDIIHNMQRVIRGKKMVDMTPFYKGFKGTITPHHSEPGKYDVCGTIEKKSDTTLEITELPVKQWTSAYKEFLEEMMTGEKKPGEDSEHIIDDIREYHSEENAHFVLSLSPEKMAKVEARGLEKVFKLKTSMSITNMFLFDAEGKIAKYDSALEILKEFVNLRLSVYDSRKKYLVAKLTREREILSNKARFILMVVQDKLELRKRKKADLLKELKAKKFTPWSELKDPNEDKVPVDKKKVDEEENEAASEPVEKSEYDYLLNMPLWNLTYEKVEELKKQLEKKKAELAEIIGTTIETMWDKDLVALLAQLDEADRKEAKERAEGDGKPSKKAKGSAKDAAEPPKKVAPLKTQVAVSAPAGPIVAVKKFEIKKAAPLKTWDEDKRKKSSGEEHGPESMEDAPDTASKRRGRKEKEDEDMEPETSAPPMKRGRPAKENSSSSKLKGGKAKGTKTIHLHPVQKNVLKKSKARAQAKKGKGKSKT
jgi:DNA topoisomerase-2